MLNSFINFFKLEKLVYEGPLSHPVYLNFNNLTLKDNLITNAESFFYVLNYDYPGEFGFTFSNSSFANNIFKKPGHLFHFTAASQAGYQFQNSQFFNNSQAVILVKPTSESRKAILSFINCFISYNYAPSDGFI